MECYVLLFFVWFFFYYRGIFFKDSGGINLVINGILFKVIKDIEIIVGCINLSFFLILLIIGVYWKGWGEFNFIVNLFYW